jgi:hypothetical protein
MKPYTLSFIISLILAVVIVVSTLFLPILIGNAVDVIISKGNVDFLKLSRIIVQMLMCILVNSISQGFMSKLHNHIVFCMVRDLRKNLFAKIQRLPVKFIDSKAHGTIISNIVSDVEQFSDGMLLGFGQFFTGILTIILTLFFILRLNVALALLVLIITPLSLFVSAFIAKKSFTYFKSQSEKRAAVTGIVDEMISGMSTVKAFSTEEQVTDEFKEADKNLGSSYLKAIFYSALVNPATRFVNSIVYMCVGVAGALFAMNGAITIGQLVTALNYANQYTKPFNEISTVITELQNSLACADRIFALLDEEEVVLNPNAIDIKNVKGDIKLENVAFSYSKDSKFIEDLNLVAKKGKRIAIVGPTGCGKTTLINLLMRFYEIDSGKITLDEMDIKDISLGSLRGSFGMVLQETWLQTGTVRENIAMGKQDATFEEIETAAKEAYADNFIKKLPQGYDTVIRQNGENLSAGQRQLLCIARAMLALPTVLILDEATSSIDTRTELKVQQAFDKLMKSRTSFIVAHRLSTIKQADLILVMKDGKIIERGTHEELINADSFYTKLYNSQYSA